MITSLHVKNFKCLRDVHVDLGPFTVLIGPNDSGKTSFLDAIKVLGLTTQGQFSQGVSPEWSLPKLVWRGDLEQNISWQVKGITDSFSFAYELEVSPKTSTAIQERLLVDGQLRWESTGQQGDNVRVRIDNNQVLVQRIPGMTVLANVVRTTSYPYRQVAEAMRATIKYRLDPDALRRPAAGNQTSNETSLAASGDNLVSVLDAIISDPDRSKIIALERALHEAIPTLQGIALPRTNPNVKSLAFTLAGDRRPLVTIPAALASDGALLVTGFLALAYGDTPPLLFVEEPENGIHPFLLKHIVQLLRKISTGDVGDRPRQVILTTHSPILVNFIQPEEVRIFARDGEGGTQVTPMKSAPNIDNLLKEFAAGELWYLLGEQALVEGKQV